MFTPTKTKEKPSIVSKKVLKTHHKNGTESYLLTEKIKTLEHKQSQKNIDFDHEVNSLKKKMEAVQRVKNKISLSKERRMLLRSQGFTIRVCKGKSEDEIILRRDSMQVEAGNWATLLANPPDLTAQNEPLEVQDAASDSSDDCSSSSESTSNGRLRSFSLSSVADTRPTQVSRYRVIEPPLRPGSRRGFCTVTTTPALKTDKEISQEFNDDFSRPISARASTRWDAIKNRPFSARSQFVETVIAARDNKYFASNQDATHARREQYWRRKYITGRRTKSAPVNVRSTTTFSKEMKVADQRSRENKELKSPHAQKNLTLKSDETVGFIEQKQETSQKNKTLSQSNQISQSEQSVLNEDQQDGLSLSRGSVLTPSMSNVKVNDSTQCASLCLDGKDETKDPRTEMNKESEHVINTFLIKTDGKRWQRSKSASNSNEFLPNQMSKMSTSEVDADVLNPSLLNGQEVVSSEVPDVHELCLKSKQENCHTDSDKAVQESSGKTYLALPDKISRMSIRRHSADCEMNNASTRFHGNEARNRYPNKDARVEGHVTLQLPKSPALNRRMSHPPRIMSFQGDADRFRKRKSIKSEDEVVYAYDARPNKSLAKGYRAMQMTVGGRQVKLNMVAFPKESGAINADRARLHTKLSSSLKEKSKES